MSVLCPSEPSRLRAGERPVGTARPAAPAHPVAHPASSATKALTGVSHVVAGLTLPAPETDPTHTYPPRLVGRMADREPPSTLPDVGTRVELPDGRVGVVRHYECYSEHQATFPVQVGQTTTTWVLSALKVVDTPEADVPTPRPSDA
ncbi:hypothetical protein [Actinokineospora iranica]|uniref:Uncharacterized protein n=1 Tax=Actinokineospora iranica TaxID=1271860 RepID=A0A1G6P9P1_9PSEU|nr:hypothetical protein [Actinokineospora iranica]SDC76324.1 hypothetical protein SAMN05216174_104165 [Actinokineospora iranica]